MRGPRRLVGGLSLLLTLLGIAALVAGVYGLIGVLALERTVALALAIGGGALLLAGFVAGAIRTSADTAARTRGRPPERGSQRTARRVAHHGRVSEITIIQPRAGWFADPTIPGQERWWDGAEITDCP